MEFSLLSACIIMHYEHGHQHAHPMQRTLLSMMPMCMHVDHRTTQRTVFMHTVSASATDTNWLLWSKAGTLSPLLSRLGIPSSAAGGHSRHAAGMHHMLSQGCCEFDMTSMAVVSTSTDALSTSHLLTQCCFICLHHACFVWHLQHLQAGRSITQPHTEHVWHRPG